MSRIGKKPISIPSGTEVRQSGNTLSVKGSVGTIERELNPLIKVEVKESEVQVNPTDNSKEARAMWGTYASHIGNMIAGANKPFEKKLVIEGIGFKAAVAGNKLTLNLGFSHPIELITPEGLSVEVQKNIVTIAGINKDDVGQFAAKIRELKKPEPYKGKGIRYEDEVIRRKQGKKTV